MDLVAEARADQWTEVVDFYHELIKQHGWRQGPMLEFVSWLAVGPCNGVLFPSTSHEGLGLASIPTYPERLAGPMVYILYWEPRGFVVEWRGHQCTTVRKETVASPQAPEVFGRILDWLGIATPRPTEPAE